MKKLLFAATIIAAALSSCSQNEITSTLQEGNEIGFTSYSGSSTKAIDVTSTTLENEGFYAQARYTTSGADLYGANLFNHAGGSYKGTATWYWPSGGEALDFFAYNKTIADNATNISLPATAGEKPSFEFTTTDKGSTQKDIIVAYATNQTKPTSGTTPLTFKHALSKITANVTANTPNTDFKLVVEKIIIKDVKTSGSCTVEPTDSDRPTWASLADTKDIELELNSTLTSGIIGANPATKEAAMHADNAIMIIPQTLTNIEIYYKWIQVSNGNIIENHTITPVTNTITDIASNTHYEINYSILPATNEIVFSVSVSSWEPGSFSF